MSAPRVLLADAELLPRTGLGVTLTSAGFMIAGEAEGIDDAVALARDTRPDLVIVAAELPGGAIEAVRRISAEEPSARVVVLAGRPDGPELVAAMQAGAAGYVVAEGDQKRLPATLRAVLEGEVALPRRYTQHLVDALRGRDTRRDAMRVRGGARITEREWEVMELLAAGASSAEVARRLQISEVTVRRHTSAVVAKLGVRDRMAAIGVLRQRSGG